MPCGQPGDRAMWWTTRPPDGLPARPHGGDRRPAGAICRALPKLSLSGILPGSIPRTPNHKLMQDDDVTKKSGIYPYVLDGDERNLNVRAFTDNMKREAYERQKGVCPVCRKKFEIEAMEADHITPWHEGGKTSAENCQMLCKEDNRRKSGV